MFKRNKKQTQQPTRDEILECIMQQYLPAYRAWKKEEERLDQHYAENGYQGVSEERLFAALI